VHGDPYPVPAVAGVNREAWPAAPARRKAFHPPTAHFIRRLIRRGPNSRERGAPQLIFADFPAENGATVIERRQERELRMTRISARRTERRSGGLKQLPWRRLRNPYPPMRVVSDDQIEAIHETALEILETLGLEIFDDEALDRLGASATRSTARTAASASTETGCWSS